MCMTMKKKDNIGRRVDRRKRSRDAVVYHGRSPVVSGGGGGGNYKKEPPTMIRFNFFKYPNDNKDEK